MANSKRKCTNCKERFATDSMIKFPAGYFHSIDCSIKYAIAAQGRQRARQLAKTSANIKKKEKTARALHRQDKERVKRRGDWLDQLQALVNQYVMHVRDVGKPCCTCGTMKLGIKYDAGHCFTRASRSDIRFELTNIHRQCSIRCNVYGSGMRKEYKDFIIKTYGQDHWGWLEEVKPSLKEQFPDYHAIKKEIARYRTLLRDNGVKPNR